VMAAALLLVLLLGTCGLIAALRPPTLTLSATTVHPGDSLTATASHVPGNQAGEIQLLSRLSVFPFRADEKGNVTDVKIVEANPPRFFDRSVINALSQWKFQADGEKYVGEIEVEFKMTD